MNTIFEQYQQQLFLVFQRAFAEMLRNADSAGDWDRVIGTLKRHGANESLISAPFTALGWERVTLRIDRSRLGDSKHVDEVSSFLSLQWLALLKRELKAGSVPVLMRMDAPTLLACMSTLYVNESTGDGVAKFVLSRMADALVEDSASVQAAFAGLDRSLEAVSRVADRNADRAFRELLQRTDSRFADLAEQTRQQFDVAGQLQEARFALAQSESQRQQSGCPECKPEARSTPEFAMPRHKGLYRTEHALEDAWVYEREREQKRSCDCN